MKALFLIVFVGSASPFAMGTADSTGAASNANRLSVPSKSSSLFQQPARSMAQKMSSTVAPASENNSRFSIRKALRNLNPSGGKKDGRWKGGDAKATTASRLIFSYVSPLLDLASEKTLDENDAFEVAESKTMDKTVSDLAVHYENARVKAQRKIEEKRQKGEEGVKKSQSLVLLKALLRHQRGTLILTGFLRLTNTAIQAFPSILVARILRSIEAGNSIPASRAVNAALTLAAVLTLKMVNENQLFHQLVTMSTQTRGALEGLIFDKSLRLPGGGSGVLSKRKKGDEKKALGSGGVINLMQSDASLVEFAALQIHTTWDGLLQVSPRSLRLLAWNA